MEGNNYIVTWAIGHLVTLAMPQQYGVEGFRKEDLPLLPEPFSLIVRQIRKDGEYITLNPQLHSRSATYIKRNGLLIRKITIKSSRPFQCAYHPLTP